MQAITFIGDVHGWLDRLDRLLEQIDGAIVFVGDLIDRGPDSRGVIARVRELQAAGRARCVLGNHEYALVKALGCPERGILATDDMFEVWCQLYGADATLRSYGLAPTASAAAMRQAMGDDLVWMADLPWLIDDTCQWQDVDWRYFVVHAGLQSDGWRAQVERLKNPGALWQREAHLHHEALYDKSIVEVVPYDLPAHAVVVSGHTPQPTVYVTDQRICCDTSGGRPGKLLSAVTWPGGRVLTSA